MRPWQFHQLSRYAKRSFTSETCKQSSQGRAIPVTLRKGSLDKFAPPPPTKTKFGLISFGFYHIFILHDLA